MILEETYTLSNGVKIPKLGLGTWLTNDQQAGDVVKAAARIGYRHIDTAQAYQNEAGVGEGVRKCGIARSEMFVTTKLAAEIKSYSEAVASIDQSLRTIGLEYIDLMIIHSPQPWKNFGAEDRFLEGNLEAWRALEEAYLAGKIRAIGVSNFTISDVENILGDSRVTPMVNQVLAHVSNTPLELIEYCQKKEILVEGYSPVGHGELMKNKAIIDMAAKYHVSVPQLCIRYDLQLGLLPLPKTANPRHMQENAELNFAISETDIESLKNMEKINDYGASSNMPVFRMEG